MRESFGAATIPLLFLSIVGGCSKCASPVVEKKDAAPPAPHETFHVDLLPPPASWTFEPLRMRPADQGVAIPTGCRLREPRLVAKVRSSTKFVASASTLTELVIADADMSETPPKLKGVAAVKLDPAGTSSNPVGIPWFEAAALPRLARTKSGAWIAAYSESAEDKLSRVFVFQNGSATPLGTGDAFDAIDLSCDDDSCVLLTTRLGRISSAGADVWMGKPDEPATSWRRTEIVPKAGESDARPTCIAKTNHVDAAEDASTATGPVVTLVEGSELVFWSLATSRDPQEIARVPAPHGVIDATVLGRPVAFTYGAAVDDNGCAREGGIMKLSRTGAADIDVRAHAPATHGALRRLARGGIAAYLAPTRCGATTKVAYAVVLTDEGAPISQPMPITEASSFAIATQAENVDMWIQRDEDVVWLRATCSAP